MYKSILLNFVRSWQKQTGMQIATLSILSGVFVVIVLFFTLHKNMRQVFTHWGKEVQLNVFLKDEIKGENRSKIEKFLSAQKSVEKIKYISKEEALSEFTQKMKGHAPSFLKSDEFENPLPSSFEVGLSHSVKEGEHYSSLLSIAEQVVDLAGVEDVAYGQGWVKNYSSVVRSFKTSSWFMVAILIFGAMFIIGNSIRNSISQRREEIEIYELVGATSINIQLPYIIEGAIMTALGAILAIVFGYFIYTGQSELILSEIGIISWGADLSFLNLAECLIIIFASAALGALGSFLFVRRVSSGWAAAEKGEVW